MAVSRSSSNSPVDAVNAIYSALEPLDDETRKRVVASALSLLGMSAPNQGIASPAKPVVVSGARVPEDHRPVRAMSPVELLHEKSPATNTQKITLFAYYRERFEGQGRFSRSDLKSYFAKAKESPPANYDRDFANAVKQGWIHEDGAESYLTSKGLEAVEAGFSGKALPRGRGTKTKTRKKAAKRTKRTSRK